MPTYDYHCKVCGHKFEELQKITDDPLTQCPKCKKSSLQRGVGGGIGLTFEGSGFYITDYKKDDGKSDKPKSCGKGPCGCH